VENRTIKVVAALIRDREGRVTRAGTIASVRANHENPH
jgi:hypothetical protein